MHITNIFSMVSQENLSLKALKINSIALRFEEITENKENRVIKFQFIAFSFNIEMKRTVKV